MTRVGYKYVMVAGMALVAGGLHVVAVAGVLCVTPSALALVLCVGLYLLRMFGISHATHAAPASEEQSWK